MYNDIPTVLRSDEILDKALGRAAKIVKEDKVAFYKAKKTTRAQLESIQDTLVDSLGKYAARFPNLDKVDTYERELIDVVVGADKLKKALARVHGSLATVQAISQRALGDVDHARRTPDIMNAKRSTIGRLASIVDELESPLRFLSHARDVLRAIPDVTPGDPTIVLGGYPNVGKSSLLARLTRAKPDIAPYPFTTKAANIGHFEWPPDAQPHRRRRYQVVDTPGLLEKDPKDRNAIEQQAALALRHLADLIVFVLDPSEACGYDLPAQERFLERLRREFEGIPTIVVETKSDLRKRKGDALKVSSLTGEGVTQLRDAILRAIPEDKYQDLFADELERS